MNAVLKEEAEQPDTILAHYATEQEIEDVRAVFTSADALRADVAHIRTALGVTMRNISNFQYNAREKARNAAARALGETVTEPPAPERTLQQLQDEERGLMERLKEAEDALANHGGDCRRSLQSLLRVCAERCAEDYVEATQKQAWCHQQLSLVQAVAGSGSPVVDFMYWGKYFVPGSDHLAALKGRSQAEWGLLTCMSAERLSVQLKDTQETLRKHCQEMFGASPF